MLYLEVPQNCNAVGLVKGRRYPARIMELNLYCQELGWFVEIFDGTKWMLSNEFCSAHLGGGSFIPHEEGE